MEYKVLDFNQTTGTLLVNFFTADYPEGLTYGVDVPVVGGAYISGEDLNTHIMSFAPYGQIERLVTLRDSQITPPAVVIEPQRAVNPILDAKDLNDAIVIAHAQIDATAGQVRARFITTVPGQEATYMLKREQATQFKAAGYQGTPPSFIAAEVAATGKTAKDVADAIIFMANIWENDLGPRIEAFRIAGKEAASASQTKQGVNSATDDCITKLRGVAA